MEIKWDDVDPETERKRFLRAVRFAGVWTFSWRFKRGENWNRDMVPTRAMWEHVLDGLKRRYRRREGVDDKDIAQVEGILRNLP